MFLEPILLMYVSIKDEKKDDWFRQTYKERVVVKRKQPE